MEKIKLTGAEADYLDSFARKIHSRVGSPLEIANLLSYTT